MPNIYIHLNGESIEKKLLGDYGMVEEDKPEEQLRMIPCSRCKFKNLPNGSLCSNCSLPLNDEAAMHIENIQKETTALIDNNMLSEMIKKIILAEMEKKERMEV